MRRKRNDDDSLDMLLDTITNTFGGIVFLALLIVILTQNQKTDSGTTNHEAELDAISAKIEQLEMREIELRQLQSAQSIVTGMDGLDDNAESMERLKEIASEYREDQKAVGDLLSQQLTENKQTVLRLAEVDQVQREMQSEKSRGNQLAKKYDAEVESRKKQIATPKEKETNNAPVTVIVSKGRLYFLQKDLNRTINEVNLRDFENCSEPEATVLLGQGNYRPKPSGGILLTDSNSISKKLAPMNRQNYFLQIAIWDDSFSNFESLQKVCRNIGLEYQLILMSDGKRIVESANVPPPRVQVP
ncbi:MAG: hypothetical protein GY818_03175 [Planctomycetaceae bacterium]|nr:hypothetical protein [Planctomycetaceae bacterium]